MNNNTLVNSKSYRLAQKLKKLPSFKPSKSEPISERILNVRQHCYSEVGNSDTDPTYIGTKNVVQCVMMIIHIPTHNFAALAHIDYATTQKSIEEFIKNAQDKFKNEQSNVYVVGGENIVPQCPLSARNVQITKEILQKFDVNIQLWDVLDKRTGEYDFLFNRFTGKLIKDPNPSRDAYAAVSVGNKVVKTRLERIKEELFLDPNLSPPVKPHHVQKEKILQKMRVLLAKISSSNPQSVPYDKTKKYQHAYWKTRDKKP